MQSRDEFVAQRAHRWRELESLLTDKALHRQAPPIISRIGVLYRMVCSDLMRARSLGLGSDVTGHLDALAGRAHNLLYGPKPYRLRGVWELVAYDFPRSLRKNWRYFLLSNALFYLPLAVGLLGAMASTEFSESVLPASMLRSMEEAYSEGFSKGRGTGTDAAMTGFYVYNNVGIAFRCFATGVLFGFGSMFFLIYNGLVIGAVLGHVIHVGYGHNILTFICGHGPFELTAIVISGAAGLKMGYALVRTEGTTRVASLRRAGPELFHLIVGAALMLFIAALIEGFWSPSSIAPEIKWAFSGLMSLLITLYLLFAGRDFLRTKTAARRRREELDRPPPSSTLSVPPSRASLLSERPGQP